MWLLSRVSARELEGVVEMRGAVGNTIFVELFSLNMNASVVTEAAGFVVLGVLI